jgi:hypothetical protein
LDNRRNFIWTANIYCISWNSNSRTFNWWNYTTYSRNLTEEYDGTSWTAGGNLGTGRSQEQEQEYKQLGLAFGGSTSTSQTGATEEYDGIILGQQVESLNTARYCFAGAGGHKQLL